MLTETQCFEMIETLRAVYGKYPKSSPAREVLCVLAALVKAMPTAAAPKPARKRTPKVAPASDEVPA